MQDLYKTIKYRGYNINIKYDRNAESPRKGDNLGVIYSSFKSYNPDNRSISEIYNQKRYQDEDGRFDEDKFSEDYIWLYVYAYIYCYAYFRSGITIFCHRSGQYTGKWNSDLFGIIAIEKNVVMKEYKRSVIGKQEQEFVKSVLEKEIKDLNAYYNGDVYRYTITKVNDNRGEEECKSCWNYFGEDELDYVEKLCKNIIDKKNK